MKCLVKIGFAGINYAGARGTEINLPLSEAISLQSQGIVKILEEPKDEIAYETAEEAMPKEQAVSKVGRKRRGLQA